MQNNNIHKSRFKPIEENICKRVHYPDICKDDLDEINIPEGYEITIHMVHINHLDMIWYWRLPDTIEMCLETIKWNVELLERHPDARYSHTQALTLKIVEELDNELFQRFAKLVEQGRIELDSGQILEPDHNIPCGESIARQFLYGQHYFKDRFGKCAEICINSDSFGHCRSLPQIMIKSGIKAFIFKRPTQNAADLPETPFIWKGIDGSLIPAVRFKNKGRGLPSLSQGTILDDNINPLQHKIDINISVGIHHFFASHCLSDAGGVTPYVSPCKGKGYTLKYSTPTEFYNSLMLENPDLQVLDAYLNRGMDGCYTTHIGEKENCRRAERELRQTESLWSIVSLFGNGSEGYPFSAIESNWWRFSLLQFHDALPGSTSTEAYKDDMAIYHEIFLNLYALRRKAQLLLDKMLIKMQQKDECFYSRQPLRTFTVINIRASNSGGIVETDVDMKVNPEDSGEEPGSKLIEEKGMLKGPGGILTPYQIIQKRIYQRYIRGKMIFDGGILPPLTPVCFEITNDITQKESKVRAYNNVIENEYIHVEVGGPGIIRSIINRSTNREYLKKISSPVCIELWPEIGGNCWTLGKLDKREKAEYKGNITVIENGPVRATIRTEHSWNNSIFITEVSLYSGQRWVELRMEIQWYEKEVLARLCIKPELNGKHQKIYGIPFGYEKATGDEKEVPAVTWAALGDDDIGIAVIDKDRPGHTFIEDALRISLVRCSTQPSFEPRSDSGVINTSFRLVPFDGKLQDAKIPLLADEFCHPSITWQRISEVQLQQECTKERQDIIKSNQSGNQVKQEGQINSNYSTLLHMEGQGISTSCFKAAENKDGYILRLYESKGINSSAIIKLSKKLSNYIVYEGNLLEEENRELKVDNNCININFKPFEIKTIIFRSKGTIPEITVGEFCT